MAHYLVTGGCGFIGSHVADSLLADGHRVRILDDLSTGKQENAPDAAEVFIGDVGDRRTVEAAMAGVDGCFHLAAVASVPKSVEDWPGTNRTNLAGTVNVFDAARTCRGAGPASVVYASSAAIYGDTENFPIREATPHAPLTPYGADKAACELHARVAARAFGVANTGMRFFNVFGPRQDPSSPYSGVISVFVDRFNRGAPLDIFGDGLQGRDFVHVSDVVRALRAAMDRPAAAGQVYNVCTGRLTTLLDLVNELSALFGWRPQVVHHAARAGDIRMSLGDPSRLGVDLRIVARTSLRAGLATLIPTRLAA